MGSIKVKYSEQFVKRVLKMYEQYSDEEIILEKEQLIDGFRNGKIDGLSFSRNLSKLNACMQGRGIKG